MTDLVERQVVLDTIHRFFTEEVDKIPTKKTEDGEVLVIRKCQPLFEMNKAICKCIKALQAVNPQEPKWIPVSERLPEDGQSVLFCDIDDDIMVGYHVKGRPDTHFSQDGTYEDMKNVRAWMPLPEPYKAESENIGDYPDTVPNQFDNMTGSMNL